MKLNLCILIILPICSYEANTVYVCDPVTRGSLFFILESKKEMRRELERFDTPPEAVETTLEVKRCVDHMMYEDRVEVSEALTRVIFDCNWEAAAKLVLRIAFGK